MIKIYIKDREFFIIIRIVGAKTTISLHAPDCYFKDLSLGRKSKKVKIKGATNYKDAQMWVKERYGGKSDIDNISFGCPCLRKFQKMN